jgi:hypothetical protein
VVVAFLTLGAAAQATLVVDLVLIVEVVVVVMIQEAEVAAEAILEAEAPHEVYREADADQQLSTITK